MTQPVLREDEQPWVNDDPASTPQSSVANVTARPVLSCVLLGEEPLAARCGDVLLERGHQILGLVSGSAALSQWARSRNIPVFARSAYRP